MSGPLRTRRRACWIAAPVLVGAVAWAAWSYATHHRPPPPEPRMPDLTAADPAITALIESARDEVRKRPDDARAWGKFGIVLYVHGFNAEADESFRCAEHLDDAEPRWPYYRGLALSNGNLDPAAAVAEFQRAVERWGEKEPAPRLRLANQLLAVGRLDEAADLFAQVLEREPHNAPAQFGLAQVSSIRDDPEAALKRLAFCLADGGTVKPARTLRAECLDRQGDHQAAAQERSLAGRLPDKPLFDDPFLEELVPFKVGKRVRIARIHALVHEGRMVEAATLIGEIEQDYPDEPDILLPWCRILLRQGRAAEAVETLRKVVEKQPGLVDGWFYLGGALLVQGKPAEAEKCFRRAADLQPDFPEAYFNIGLCLTKQGKGADAVREYEQALHYDPAYARAHVELAELLSQAGHAAEARKHLEQALSLEPDDPRAKLLLKDVGNKSGGKAPQSK